MEDVAVLVTEPVAITFELDGMSSVLNVLRILDLNIFVLSGLLPAEA